MTGLTGAATAVWQVGVLRRPAQNAFLADMVPAAAYGRAYGFERGEIVHLMAGRRSPGA